MTKRIFISIDPPDEIQALLKNIANREIRWIKWMNLNNLHITLNFLGELDDEKIQEAKNVIYDTVPFYEPFKMEITKQQAVRDMLWLVPKQNETLTMLQHEMKMKMKKAKVGKTERRPYAPHFLIGKSKRGRHMEQGVLKDFTPFSFMVEEIFMYASELTPGSATHTKLDSFRLGETP